MSLAHYPRLFYRSRPSLSRTIGPRQSRHGSPSFSTRNRSFCVYRNPRPVLQLKQNAGITVTYRYASTEAGSTSSRLRNFFYGTGAILFFTFGYLYVTDTRASFHQWLVVPSLRLLHSDPEEAHHAGIRYIKALDRKSVV